MLGVWTQSVAQMDAWKARGANTLVEVPQGHDITVWTRAAQQHGFYQIRPPSADLTADLNEKGLLAWSTEDGPSDRRRLRLDHHSVEQDPEEVVHQAAPWRAAARAAGKVMPIWTNHIASHIYPDWAQNDGLMRDYMSGGASDWLAADSYPNQEGRPMVIDTNDGYTSTTQGITIDRQRAWSGGKPVMAIIGVSAYLPSLVVPTPDQFRLMAWSSIIHGAVGIIYFPVRLPPSWAFDATPQPLVQEITAFDSQVSQLTDVLIDSRAGGRRPFRLWRSAKAGSAPSLDQLPYPFEATEIATAKGPFRIVLNLSNQPRTFDRADWGIKSAPFRPYEVKLGFAASLKSAP